MARSPICETIDCYRSGPGRSIRPLRSGATDANRPNGTWRSSLWRQTGWWIFTIKLAVTRGGYVLCDNGGIECDSQIIPAISSYLWSAIESLFDRFSFANVLFYRRKFFPPMHAGSCGGVAWNFDVNNNCDMKLASHFSNFVNFSIVLYFLCYFLCHILQHDLQHIPRNNKTPWPLKELKTDGSEIEILLTHGYWKRKFIEKYFAHEV